MKKHLINIGILYFTFVLNALLLALLIMPLLGETGTRIYVIMLCVYLTPIALFAICLVSWSLLEITNLSLGNSNNNNDDDDNDNPDLPSVIDDDIYIRQINSVFEKVG